MRKDFRAALNVLERAAALLPDERCDGRFEVELCWARINTSRGAEAIAGLSEGATRAEAVGDRITALGLRLNGAGYELVFKGTDTGATRLRELIEEARPVFEAAGDEWGLSIAWSEQMILEDFHGSRGAAVDAAKRLVEHARRADYPTVGEWAQGQLVIHQFLGATPVEECLSWLDEHPEVERRAVLPRRDRLLAMLGRFEEAQRLLTEAADRVAELSVTRFQIQLAWHRSYVAMLEGELAAAETAAREACDVTLASAEMGNFMWLCCNLAQALTALGRDDDAEQWVERGRETDPSEFRSTQILWRQVQGKVLARRGELEEGERLAREAVAMAEETDMLNAHADALVDFAEVLDLAGQDGRAQLEQALALYERKGNLVMAERTRAKLA